MPDTKITALTAIGANPIIPATFPIPMVDLTDTSMAASGTTKKVTVNQILGAGGTATLASATITGDLTAARLIVTGGTIPTNGLWLPTTNTLEFAANSLAQYRIAPLGVFSWFDGAGGTRMTLNATGLGIGASPTDRLTVWGGSTTNGDARFNVGLNDNTSAALGTGAGLYLAGYTNGTAGAAIFASIKGIKENGTAGNTAGALVFTTLPNGGSNVERMRIDSAGNVGVGVTPSAWNTYKAVQVGYASLGGYAGQDTVVGSNVYYESGSFKYISTAAACSYRQNSGGHNWNVAASGTAGNAITFTQAMTLTAGGDLLVGTTSNTNSSRVFVRGTGTNPSLAIQGATGDLAQPGLLVGKFDNDSTTSQILVRFTINNNASGSGQINANGANQAAFGSFSDSRLKENIVSLPSQLANILSLRPVEFDYKDGSGHQIGFVAQEMQEVYSDAVGEQNGFLTVTGWSKTEARLVSAIKELAAKVQALEAKLA